MDSWDPQQFALPKGQRWNGEVPPSSKPPRHKGGELFIKGPVPLVWLGQASSLSCGALRVGLVLWFEAGCRRSRTVTMGPALLAKLGIPRNTGQRGLAALESAGLVSVERHRGRCPVVTILGVDDEKS